MAHVRLHAGCASAQFKAGEYSKAINKYEKALRYHDQVRNTNTNTKTTGSAPSLVPVPSSSTRARLCNSINLEACLRNRDAPSPTLILSHHLPSF
jgi:hypothetical protein